MESIDFIFKLFSNLRWQNSARILCYIRDSLNAHKIYCIRYAKNQSGMIRTPHKIYLTLFTYLQLTHRELLDMVQNAEDDVISKRDRIFGQNVPPPFAYYQYEQLWYIYYDSMLSQAQNMLETKIYLPRNYARVINNTRHIYNGLHRTIQINLRYIIGEARKYHKITVPCYVASTLLANIYSIIKIEKNELENALRKTITLTRDDIVKIVNVEFKTGFTLPDPIFTTLLISKWRDYILSELENIMAINRAKPIVA
ncbi:hypothetical protein JW960_22275 [candidate division KSB1 bacterium]|nr:hypothetical protein [candidate division KSB1 bacterium]